MLNFTRTLLGLAAIGLAIFAIYMHSLAGHSKSWPSVEGKLEVSTVKTFGDGSFDQYAPYVRYSYRVGDKVFNGYSVRIWDMSLNSRKLAAEYLSYRTKGDVVTIYYDPENPGQAILDRAYPLGVVVLLTLVALLLGVVAIFTRQIVDGVKGWLLQIS